MWGSISAAREISLGRDSRVDSAAEVALSYCEKAADILREVGCTALDAVEDLFVVGGAGNLRAYLNHKITKQEYYDKIVEDLTLDAGMAILGGIIGAVGGGIGGAEVGVVGGPVGVAAGASKGAALGATKGAAAGYVASDAAAAAFGAKIGGGTGTALAIAGPKNPAAVSGMSAAGAKMGSTAAVVLSRAAKALARATSSGGNGSGNTEKRERGDNEEPGKNERKIEEVRKSGENGSIKKEANNKKRRIVDTPDGQKKCWEQMKNSGEWEYKRGFSKPTLRNKKTGDLAQKSIEKWEIEVYDGNKRHVGVIKPSDGKFHPELAVKGRRIRK